VVVRRSMAGWRTGVSGSDPLKPELRGRAAIHSRVRVSRLISELQLRALKGEAGIELNAALKGRSSTCIPAQTVLPIRDCQLVGGAQE
jgi:hypothetical protein